MRPLRALLARLAGVFTGRRGDDDLRAELESHLEMETAENIRRGMDPDEARRQARVASGGISAAADAVRDQRGLPWLEGAAADLRYALRTLRHSPVFTTVVVLTLGLGIGANTAIFSVVRAVLLKPLPHRDGDRLVYLRQSMDGPGGTNLSFSVPEVRDLRTGAPSLGGGLAEHSGWSAILQEEDGARRIRLGLVTGNFFDVMGLGPVLGRVTNAGDDGPAASPVMVLTHGFWMNHFSGDSSLVGRTVTMDGKPVTVIGVMQPAPFFPSEVDGLANMVFSAHHMSAFMNEGRTHRMTELVARLAPGASLEQARGEVAAVTARIHDEFRAAYDPGSHYRTTVIPFQEVLGERARTTLWLLMGAAAFVLIISAANVANLTLMRGVRREHELITRAALGAGVARLRRLLLAENLVLTLLGALLGIALANGGVKLLIALAARYSPRAGEITLDISVLGFALALSVALALLLSAIAALPREGGFAAWVSASGYRMTGGLRRQRLQRALVALQVAVSVVLLAGAGLLTRTMIQLSNVSTGLETEEVLTMRVALVSTAQAITDPNSGATAMDRYETMRREIAALPGVTAVGVGSPMPLRRSDVRFDIKAEGRTPVPGEAMPNAEMRTADPHFFRAAGIPLKDGRLFDATDMSGPAKVVIVNQTLADRLFPGQDPLGQRVAWTGDVLRFTRVISDEWRTVIGVVGNTRDGSLDATQPRMVVYQPFAGRLAALGGGLVIRTGGDAAALVSAATRIVRHHAPTAPIEQVMTIAQIKDLSVSPRRLNAALISAFGILAVLVAAVGIAGVLAFSVSARTTEIGIRMSLGAAPGRVQRMILREGGVLVITGLALGLAGATVAARAIEGLLFDVAPDDPATLGGVALLMGAIGLIACWIPAWRASRIDPAITMRSA